MLTRRGFSSFAVCAVCEISEFIATEASAQGTQPAATPGVTRKILSQMDGPAPGYVTLLVDATIEPGVMVARHTHPGIKSAYVLEGASNFPFKVNQPALLNQAMASKYRRKRRMRAVNLGKRKQEFSSPTWWRRESPSHLPLNQ